MAFQIVRYNDRVCSLQKKHSNKNEPLVPFPQNQQIYCPDSLYAPLVILYSWKHRGKHFIVDVMHINFDRKPITMS